MSAPGLPAARHALCIVPGCALAALAGLPCTGAGDGGEARVQACAAPRFALPLREALPAVAVAVMCLMGVTCKALDVAAS